ncbi:hypothetical protein YC2023_058365 [Brassica napus]
MGFYPLGKGSTLFSEPHNYIYIYNIYIHTHIFIFRTPIGKTSMTGALSFLCFFCASDFTEMHPPNLKLMDTTNGFRSCGESSFGKGKEISKHQRRYCVLSRLDTKLSWNVCVIVR